MIVSYVYKIIFPDGCWYWGYSTYKGKHPQSDGYYGSPVTHRDRWNQPHSKIIVKEFKSEQEGQDYEILCIIPDLNDIRCLNEHAARSFSKDICKIAGKAAAEKSRGVPRTQEVKEKISKKNKGRKLTSDHIQKLREAERPCITPEATAKRIKSREGYRHSEKTKQKISESNTGKERPPELRQKIADSVAGYSWYNNGTENVQSRFHPGEEWIIGRLIKWETPRNTGMKWYHREGERKMFLDDPGEGWEQGMPRPKGKRYYNNGIDHVLASECPGDGWAPGRLSRK